MMALALNLRSTCQCIDSRWGPSSIQWGLTTLRCVCLHVCVLLCKCVSDAANCPFAVYPMGSGMSLVTACSFSLNGPVAMAAPQRPAPPPSAWRVTGQLEQGAVTRSLLWLQLWGERSQAGGTPYTGRVPTRSISKQTRRAAALQVMCAPRARHPQPSITHGTCHQERLAVIPKEWAIQTTTPRGLWEHIKRRQVDCPALLSVEDLHHPTHSTHNCSAVIHSSLHPLGKSMRQFC